MGLGYVDFFLTCVPFLRMKFFAAFKESLIPIQELEQFNPVTYYKDANVLIESSKEILTIKGAIPKIKGQILLEGDSGIGKTMFLRYLMKQSKRIIVYLSAGNCSEGIIKTIQAKLHGTAKREKFLRSLIYSGAIDIYIDNLDKVRMETYAKITGFLERYHRGRIICTTQPLG